MKAWFLVGALLAVGCSKQLPGTTLPGSSMLRHVPASTPYIVAALEPWPRAWMVKYFAQNRPELVKAIEQLRALTDPASEGSGVRLILAMLEELEPRFTVDGVRELGIGSQARFVIYGHGLLPVVRLELADGEKFQAFFERVLKKSGTETASRNHAGGRHTWTFSSGGAGAPVIAVAVVGKELVVTMAPKAFLDRTLARATGDATVGPSLADGGTLDRVARTGKFLPLLVGYVDTARVLESVDEDRDVLNAFGANIPLLSASCRKELAALSASSPMWTFGVEELTPARMRGSMTFELRPDLARELMGARVAVPGVGAPLGDSVISLAIALDLKAAIAAMRAEAERVARAPRQCHELAFVTRGAADVAGELAKPLPPPWGSIRGVAATLQDASMTMGMPRVKAYGLVAAPDPIHLIDLARQAFPSLGGLHIPEDGTPVPLPAGTMPFLPDAYVAMRGGLLGLSIGAGTQIALAALLGASPHPNRALVSVAYDEKRLSEVARLIGGEAFGAQLNGTGTISGTLEASERGLVMRIERLLATPAAPATAP